MEKISHEVFTEIAWGTWELSALTVYLQFGKFKFFKEYFSSKKKAGLQRWTGVCCILQPTYLFAAKCQS